MSEKHDAMMLWPLDRAPRDLAQHLEATMAPADRAEYRWLVWLPSVEHLARFWGPDRDTPAAPGSLARSLGAGVMFHFVDHFAGTLVFFTDNDERREIAAWG